MTELRVVEHESPLEELEAQGYPPSLAKACYDPFEYVLVLRSGTLLHFESASPRGQWVHIEFGGYAPPRILDAARMDRAGHFSFDRGMDVRVADIVWCADAPNGS